MSLLWWRNAIIGLCLDAKFQCDKSRQNSNLDKRKCQRARYPVQSGRLKIHLSVSWSARMAKLCPSGYVCRRRTDQTISEHSGCAKLFRCSTWLRNEAGIQLVLLYPPVISEGRYHLSERCMRRCLMSCVHKSTKEPAKARMSDRF